MIRGILDKSFIEANVQKERIIAVTDNTNIRRKKNASQVISGWSDKISLFQSNNFFKTRKVVQKNGNRFLLSNEFLFVATCLDVKTQDSALVVADPKQKFYTFAKVDMPMKRFKEHSYTILDTSEGQVFI